MHNLHAKQSTRPLFDREVTCAVYVQKWTPRLLQPKQPTIGDESHKRTRDPTPPWDPKQQLHCKGLGLAGEVQAWRCARLEGGGLFGDGASLLARVNVGRGKTQRCETYSMFRAGGGSRICSVQCCG